MILIRAAGSDDIPEIAAIERECFSPPWSEKSLAEELDSTDTFFAVAAEDGRVVGFCIARAAGDEAELYQIAVRERDRRRGAASALMDAMLAWARASGATRVFLEVRAGNAPAAALYEKHGFSVICTRKDYYSAPVEDALIMRGETGRRPDGNG